MSLTAGLLTPAVVVQPTVSWQPSTSESRVVTTPVAYQTTMLVQELKRKVFPYSIVPGGALDLREAKQAMSDPEVKANYADVDFAKLQQVKLTENLSGYVSYRWGDKIYWTKKPLTLRAGETVYTDGTHIVRGRCLNCYSKFPMLPVRPTEPTEKAFDAPVEMPVTVYSFPKLPVMAPELPIPAGDLTPTVPVFVPAVLPGVAKGGGGFWFPLIPIIPPIHRHPSGPSTPNGPIPPPVIPPLAVVPEPRYGSLLALGLVAMALVHAFRRRRA
jgi:hypothetical protein